MTIIDFDPLNVRVRSKVRTNPYLKALLQIFNLFSFAGLIYLASNFVLTDEKHNPIIFLLPIGYFFTLGRYLLWNVWGEELCIISISHLSYLHNYGIWKTSLKTLTYDYAFINNEEEDTNDNTFVKLIFIKYNEEKLPIEIFETAIDLLYADAKRIFSALNEMKIDEFSEEAAFPKIYAN